MQAKNKKMDLHKQNKNKIQQIFLTDQIADDIPLFSF